MPPKRDIESFFHVKKSSAYSSTFDLAPRYQIDVDVLKPSNVFYRRLTKHAWFSQINASSLPFKDVKLGKNSADISSITVERFGGNSFLVRISAKIEAQIDYGGLSSLYQSLSELRSPRNLSPIDSIYLEMKDLLISSNAVIRPQTKFAILVHLPMDDPEYKRQSLRSRKALIAFHIGVPQEQDIDMALVQEVEETCADLNLKSPRETMVANEQGITYILPAGNYSSPYIDRFEKGADLMALATYFQEVLLDRSGRASSKDNEWQSIYRLSERWVRFSRNVLHSSVSNRVLWDVLKKAYALDTLVQELEEVPLQ